MGERARRARFHKANRIRLEAALVQKALVILVLTVEFPISSSSDLADGIYVSNIDDLNS